MAAGAKAGHEIRVSDAERDDVVNELGKRFAEGRITHETLVGRIEAALRAKLQDELVALLADLPSRRRPRLAAAIRSGAARSRMVGGHARRLLHAANAWTRKEPTPIMLPAGLQPRYTIGRDESCDLVLADTTVSRVHARLEQSADGWCIDDLGSTNGTRINGWRVTMPTPVAAGDFVSFGAATFVVRARPGPVASAP